MSDRSRKSEPRRKIYAAAVNPRTKEEIFPGMAPGSELTWSALAGGPQPFSHPRRVLQVLRRTRDPNWDWKTIDFDKDVAAGDAKFGAVLNAIDPDLKASRPAAAS